MARLAAELLESFEADQFGSEGEVYGGENPSSPAGLRVRHEEVLLKGVLEEVEDPEEDPKDFPRTPRGLPGTRAWSQETLVCSVLQNPGIVRRIVMFFSGGDATLETYYRMNTAWVLKGVCQGWIVMFFFGWCGHSQEILI